ncbi:MAG: alpha/beta fold hydrolase, partial [Prochlorothrix sp.]
MQQWQWRGQRIAYQQAGTTGPALVLIHGFGASSLHWRKNLEVLGETHRVYALDLLGFGRSAKPTPNQPLSYTFETWGQQVLDFCREVVQGPAFLGGNSIGCIVALQAAVTDPKAVSGLVLLNCSLRLLHDRKRQALPWYRSIGTPVIQSLLGVKAIGQPF